MSYQQSETIIDKITPKTTIVQKYEQSTAKRVEILLNNTYNQLQIILKIKAQMSYWQLFFKYEARLSKTHHHCKTDSN